MKRTNQESNSILFNLLALLGFTFGLFLIIFLKQGKSKKSEHPKTDEQKEEGRVKISPTTLDLENQLNERQLRILEEIAQEGRLDPSEIYELVPGVSTRTVRRDMDALVSLGLVVQRGSTKSTTYIFKGE
jgi:predicted HTH transcriptional regulator